MGNTEMSNMFDVLYNNITSNKAAGLNEYEKSVFLTKAQNEIVRNYFEQSSAGNTVKKGFDGSPIRQSNFSNLIKVAHLDEVKEEMPKLDVRSKQYTLPSEDKIFVLINEVMQLGNTETKVVEYREWQTNKWVTVTDVDPSKVKGTRDKATWEKAQEGEIAKEAGMDGDIIGLTITEETVKGLRQIIPLAYDEYMRLMSKPFKEPLKWQAWRLMTDGTDTGNNTVEIVLTSSDLNKYTIFDYSIRYVRRPRPIILTDLTGAFGEGLTIEGKSEETTCELNESMHDAVLQRAVELAKVAWEGDVNQAQMHITTGQRTE